jgi:hypothetical protein
MKIKLLEYLEGISENRTIGLEHRNARYRHMEEFYSLIGTFVGLLMIMNFYF